MAEMSKLMRQYMELKEQHKDALLFFRLGDFYELFFDDALIASDKLGLHLTGRETGQGRAPMCGLPHHAAEAYIQRLVEAGHKVALCEQITTGGSKGELMERKVVRVFTPGTIIDDTKSTNNYVAVIFSGNETAFGLAYADVATGDFFVTSLDSREKLEDELHKIAPKEIIDNFELSEADSHQKLVSHFGANFGFSDKCAICAAGALVHYLYETQQNSLAHIGKINPYVQSDFMILDKSTFRNLELVETLREKDTEGTLFWVMNQTVTAMGKRLLRKWLESPLLSLADIVTRHDAVAEFKENSVLRAEARAALGKISDIERLCGKITYRKVSPKDFLNLQRSIVVFPDIKGLLTGLESSLNTYFANSLDGLSDICNNIQSAFEEGRNVELDAAKAQRSLLLQQLADFEQSERQSTGIKGLKVGHNKVFGYYIEVANSQRGAVPAHYQRRQTLSNNERYATDELKQLEIDILTVEDRVQQLEAEAFENLCVEVAREIPRIQLSAHMLATIDVLQSMGEIADRYNYICPQMHDAATIEIDGGRHPVIERFSPELFVANDTYLDNFGNKIAIITGPNMAGKSTYLRQVALISIMAQMGSFVPAASASLPICDRVFTRVGASDDLARGQSTFMVEMSETANILVNATERSLIVLDEIGRGTGTTDGFSIALAIVEHIAENISAKTLFATHFHELTVAEGKIHGVANYRMEVEEDFEGETIKFLRRVVPGGADKSYGIFVAKLAGLPEVVVRRAFRIQQKLEMRGVFDDDDPLRDDKEIIAAYNAESEAKRNFRLLLDEMKTMRLEVGTMEDALEKLRRIEDAMRNLEELW